MAEDRDDEGLNMLGASVASGLLGPEHHYHISAWALLLLVSLLVLFCVGLKFGPNIMTYVIDPRRGSHKYILLFFICLFIPGPYFHDGLLQAFKGPICDDMDMSNSEFASLFAVSSLTGLFLVPGGAVIIRVGRARFAMVAGFVASLGSMVVTMGYHTGSLSTMLVGRFTFWFALNSLCMVQTILVFDLFKGKDLNFAMTMIVCSIRFGGSLSYPLSGPLYRELGVLNSLLLSVVLVVGAFASTVLFTVLFRGTATARAIWPMLESQEARAPFSLRLVHDVPRSVCFFLGGIAAVWGVVFPFEVIGDDMLQKEFGYSVDHAGMIIAICPMMSILSPVIAPFLGTVLHEKLRACGAGCALLTCGFCLIFLRCPILGIFTIGAGYAVSVCSFYSTIPLLVRSAVPATIGQSVQSLVVGLNMAGSGTSMICSNLMIGIIKDRGSYQDACIYLVFVGLGGMACVYATMRFHEPIESASTDAGGSLTDGEMELRSPRPPEQPGSASWVDSRGHSFPAEAVASNAPPIRIDDMYIAAVR